MKPRYPSAAWAVALVGIFGVDPAFNNIAVGKDAVLGAAEHRAGCNADLPLNYVKSGHHFGHAVLNLQSCVHFHKIKIAVVVEQKLNGSGVYVIYSLCRFYCGDHHLLARFFVERGAWAFLDHFLVFALDRAFSLAQTNYVVVFVAEKLHFNVLYRENEFFKVAGSVAKRRFCLA